LPDNSNDGTIEIFSQSGNRKLKQQIKNSIGKIELQSKNLKPGFYLISLKIDNTIIETQKIIKLH
ncbi:MAG: T9SS type A sorting domain-containing protein, partial [Bacteroidales bacterium]|nr:T9SS type A sorting domain-containing protein [Bacteroidales bacterium]